MSNLISGKEALIALANGEEVEYKTETSVWYFLNKEISSWRVSEILNSLDSNNGSEYQFRLKPQTITINGIEVPTPFEPKDGSDKFYYLDPTVERGYSFKSWKSKNNNVFGQFGAWRTEDEIKQVVEALKSVFKPQ